MDAFPALDRFRRAVESRPDAVARFEPPLPQAKRDAIFTRLVDVPPVLVELLRWRDGTLRSQLAFAGRALLGAGALAQTKSTWDELAAAYDDPPREGAPNTPQGALWHSKWIPLASADERVVALATNPCFGESAGCIVEIDFKPAVGWRILHASLAEWLTFLSRLAEDDLLDAGSGDARVDGIAKDVSPDARSFDLGELDGRFERDYRPPESPPYPALEPGAAVVIARGSFAKCEARVVEILDADRLRVEVTVFGRKAVVEIARSDT